MRYAQWRKAVSNSLTVAWAAPAWHCEQCFTGFPFHPAAARRLRRAPETRKLYATAVGQASEGRRMKVQDSCSFCRWLETITEFVVIILAVVA
jgi:hypothetical protein